MGEVIEGVFHLLDGAVSAWERFDERERRALGAPEDDGPLGVGMVYPGALADGPDGPPPKGGSPGEPEIHLLDAGPGGPPPEGGETPEVVEPGEPQSRTDPVTDPAMSAYLSHSPWNSERPRVLVVACSDGRLQENLDDFLGNSLGIRNYDRLYTPGGGGALATSGLEFTRADHFRRECRFLVEAHRIDDLYLVFHGPTVDGPEIALCADYRRKLQYASAAEIRLQQERDAEEVLRAGSVWGQAVRIHPYRCEVTADGRVQFARL